MVEIHFSWDRMYTYLRIRKFQLSRLNGVKISQFPSRVSILESSTIFSDESVSFVRGSASFPTFEIRMGRGEGIWKKQISAKFLQIRSFSDSHHSVNGRISSLRLVEYLGPGVKRKEREKKWRTKTKQRLDRTSGKVNERLFPTLPTCVPHKGLIYRPVGSHNSVIERIISCGE